MCLLCVVMFAYAFYVVNECCIIFLIAFFMFSSVFYYVFFLFVINSIGLDAIVKISVEVTEYLSRALLFWDC